MMLLNKRKYGTFQKVSERFEYFSQLIEENDRAHNIMFLLSELIDSGKAFSSYQAKYLLEQMLDSLVRMTEELEKQTGKDLSALFEKIRVLSINSRIELIPKIKCPPEFTCSDIKCSECTKLDVLYSETPYFYDLRTVTQEQSIQVGNKMARLGEIKNVLGLPVPDGFCLSIRFFDDVLSHNNLRNRKNDFLRKVDFTNQSNVHYVCNQVQAMIIATELPEYLESIISKSISSVFEAKTGLFAVRSSAFGEDSEKHSFAGLHKSYLNLHRNEISNAVIKVLASFYTTQSVSYRFYSGIRDEDMPMSVGCIEMVKAKAAGVLYTMDPLRKKVGMIIQSVFGLGDKVVDGTVKPQEFLVFDTGDGLQIEFENKVYSISKSNQFATEWNLPEKSTLRLANINSLVNYAKIIEDHFKKPQDIEWALNENDEIIILQARPMQLTEQEETQHDIRPIISLLENEKRILLHSGECASPGFGHGIVRRINNSADINKVEENSVVIANSNTLDLSSILYKVSALITDTGSTTGHLSIIARELNVPLITNAQTAMETLKDGMEVSVLSDFGLVVNGYADVLKDFAGSRTGPNSVFLKSTVFEIWSGLIRRYLKLNLKDSKSEKFNIESCNTIHDIIRFIHETAMNNMFDMYKNRGISSEKSYKFNFDIPIELYVIDIGNGFKKTSENIINYQDILSKPFASLIDGMLTPGIMWSGFLSLDAKGFSDMMIRSIASADAANISENTRSYAFVSEHYINFFSQLGFHFSRIDALVSEKENANFINVNIRGGASSDLRKSRRVSAIALILEHYHFSTYQQDDDISGRLKGINKENALTLLEMIGRLLGAIRNVDAVMLTDEHIKLFANAFIEGDPAPGLKLKELT